MKPAFNMSNTPIVKQSSHNFFMAERGFQPKSDSRARHHLQSPVCVKSISRAVGGVQGTGSVAGICVAKSSRWGPTTLNNLSLSVFYFNTKFFLLQTKNFFLNYPFTQTFEKKAGQTHATLWHSTCKQGGLGH